MNNWLPHVSKDFQSAAWKVLVRPALLLALLNFCLDIGVMGQVASPLSRRHVRGSMNTVDFTIPMYGAYQAMGMNGHVVFSERSNTGADNHYVANKGFDSYMRWSLAINGPVSIQKNGRIWISEPNTGRYATVDTLGVVLNRARISNSIIIQIAADTSDHVYVVYGVAGGYGVMRYGASFVPDWNNFYPSTQVLDAQWGIDQRLYVTCQSGVTVIDSQGNRLKDLNGIGTNYTVFADHGLGIVSYAGDTVKVMRTDSTMALRWAKKFRPTASFYGQPYAVIAATGVASMTDNDLLVTATARVNGQWSLCTLPFADEIYQVLLNADGTVEAQETYNLMTVGSNKIQHAVTSTPFGDALVSYDQHVCNFGANANDRYCSVNPTYKMRQTCGGGVPAVSAYNFTPTVLPAMGALGSLSPSLSPAVSDTLDYQVQRFNQPVDIGYAVCELPCLTVSYTILGGGQVAFHDNAYGFHSIVYDFGDGSTGTTNDPVHNYPPYGTWSVSVTATNECGTVTKTLPVHPCSTATVSGPNAGCVGVTMNFAETSGLNSAGLSWLVNGVSMGMGSNFAWTPTAAGTYSLSTVYFDAPCRDTTTRTVQVFQGLPTAGFTFAVTGLGQLTFTNTSTGALSYNWDFGDGTSGTTTNPVKTYSSLYANNGNFSICLTATNGCGSDNFCYNFNCPIPNSSFTVPSTNGLTAQISNAATGGTLTWDFGDGSTASGVVTSHAYPAAGTFTLCQTVTNACATHSTCVTVQVDTSSAAAHRTSYSLSGFDGNLRAIAAQPNGDVLVSTASGSPSAAILAIDSTSNLRATRNWPSSTDIIELQPMAGGNFAFFANSINSPTGQDITWGSLDKFGNLLQAWYLPITGLQTTLSAYKVASGYCLVAASGSNGTPFIYVKLDQNLQLQYARSTNFRIMACLEAPDGSLWLVQQPGTNSTNLEFVHLDANGIGTETYAVTIPFQGSSAFFLSGEMAFGMDCDGYLYGMLRVSDLVPAPQGTTAKLAIVRFHTLNHDIDARLYRVGQTANANNPFHVPVIKSLEKYPDGHWVGSGRLQRVIGNTTPSWEKLFVDLDPATFTPVTMAFGTPNSSLSEQIWAACSDGNGRSYTLSKTGENAKPIEVHRFSRVTDCQLPASSLAPQMVQEYSLTSATYIPGPVASTAITSPASTWNTSPTMLSGASLLRCAATCPSGLSAAFTATTTADTLQLTSNATTGAAITWSIPGMNCLPTAGNHAPNLILALPCGTFPITLTAYDACGSSSTTQMITISGSISVSTGPDQSVCPGDSVTFHATAGFSGYLWSNGATTDSIVTNLPGTYTVVVTDSSGCSATDTVTLLQFSATTVSLGPDIMVCPGDSATFTPTSSFSSYLWSNGATASAIVVSIPGDFAIIATDSNGCSASDTVILGHFIPTAFSLGNDTAFCPDTTLLLSGPVWAGSYLWSTGMTTPSIAADTSGTYWLAITDSNSCTAADTIALQVATDCVWPGDANHDGLADNVDLLAVANGMTATGSVRPNATSAWYGQSCPDWSAILPGGVNFKHMDCDGNGAVQFADTLPIHQNYGLSHNKAGGLLGGVPVWIEPEQDSFPVGDTVFFKVHWGDAAQLVMDGQGLAFSLQIDPTHVTPATLYGRFPSSFLGSGVPDIITLTVPKPSTGAVHLAVSRHDHTGRTGHGALLRVGFLPDQVIPITSSLGYIPVNLHSVVAVDGNFASISCQAIGDSILIYDPVNATTIGKDALTCSLYPVPADQLAVLEIHTTEVSMVGAELTDIHGRLLATLQPVTMLPTGSTTLTIPTVALSEGVYFVRLTAEETVKVMKLVIAR